MSKVLAEKILHVYRSAGNVILKFGAASGSTDVQGNDVFDEDFSIVVPADNFPEMVDDVNEARKTLFSEQLENEGPRDSGKPKDRERLGDGITLKKPSPINL